MVGPLLLLIIPIIALLPLCCPLLRTRIGFYICQHPDSTTQLAPRAQIKQLAQRRLGHPTIYISRSRLLLLYEPPVIRCARSFLREGGVVVSKLGLGLLDHTDVHVLGLLYTLAVLIG